MNKFKIYRVRDKADKYFTKKKQIFDIPFRLVIVGKSQLSGKTSLVVNLVGRKEFYYNDFRGSNIFIVSPSIKNDNKLKNLIKVLKVPEENVMLDYDEELLSGIYDMIEEEYSETTANGKKPPNFLFYFDDLGFSGKLRRKYNMVSKLFMNGRHLNISTIICIQSYKQLSLQVRQNLTGLILFSISDKALEAIIEEHNFIERKDFKRIFRESTNKRHSFFVINYSNNFEHRYLNKQFLPLLIKQ